MDPQIKTDRTEMILIAAAVFTCLRATCMLESVQSYSLTYLAYKVYKCRVKTLILTLNINWQGPMSLVNY